MTESLEASVLSLSLTPHASSGLLAPLGCSSKKTQQSWKQPRKLTREGRGARAKLRQQQVLRFKIKVRDRGWLKVGLTANSASEDHAIQGVVFMLSGSEPPCATAP